MLHTGDPAITESVLISITETYERFMLGVRYISICTEPFVAEEINTNDLTYNDLNTSNPTGIAYNNETIFFPQQQQFQPSTCILTCNSAQK